MIDVSDVDGAALGGDVDQRNHAVNQAVAATSGQAGLDQGNAAKKAVLNGPKK